MSDRSFAKIVSETLSYGDAETGGVFLGMVCPDGTWYVTDVVDAGLVQRTTHTSTYFVYDEEYVNHRIKKESMAYRMRPTCLGFFHRHPGHLDTFSMPDEQTMREHCDMSRHGILSMLVNIDPDFRMTFYYASKEGELFHVPYQKGDYHIPEKYLEMAGYREIADRFHRSAGMKKEMEGEEDIHACSVTTSEGMDSASGQNEREHPYIWKEGGLMFSDENLLTRISRMEAHRHETEETLMIPEEVLQDDFEGPLYGFKPDTGAYTVLSYGMEGRTVSGSGLIGYKVNSEQSLRERVCEADRDLLFVRDGQAGVLDHGSGKIRKIKLETYSMVQSLTSRNSGLLETDWMKDATAVISGCGSVVLWVPWWPVSLSDQGWGISYCLTLIIWQSIIFAGTSWVCQILAERKSMLWRKSSD